MSRCAMKSCTKQAVGQREGLTPDLQQAMYHRLFSAMNHHEHE